MSTEWGTTIETSMRFPKKTKKHGEWPPINWDIIPEKHWF
jgi:hypothetical protein